MGLPYSKQINAAFEQVTPLVAAGFEVLQTTRNISLMLAVIQVLTALFLLLILLALLAVLISINPNLERERDELVTPMMQSLSNGVLWLAGFGQMVAWALGIIAAGLVVGTGWGLWYTGRDPTLVIEEQDAQTAEEELTGEDIEAIKKGETEQ